MNIQHIWAIFLARNAEFFRDRAAFGWNFAFPFLIIIGFGLIFSGERYQQYKIGVFPSVNVSDDLKISTIPAAFYQDKYLNFIPFAKQSEGTEKLRQHKIDLLLDITSSPPQYFINDSSPKGYIAEQLFIASHLTASDFGTKQLISGNITRYIDYLFPGILAMNMMFSALWGVGYVVVRYRKNGALKRLKATPLTPFEFLSAQMFSRLFLLMFTLIIVWAGADFILEFNVQGSYFSLLVIFFLGSLSLTSLGLILAARGTSEEFTSGILNFITWPMMFLSEVWFSLEGAPEWLKGLAKIFPLTHMLTGARRVMNEGASLFDIRLECFFLLAFTIISLTIAAYLFSWNE